MSFPSPFGKNSPRPYERPRARRAPVDAKPGAWSLGKVRTLKHKFDEVRFEHGEERHTMQQRVAAVQTCRYCSQPKFAVDGLPCAGRPPKPSRRKA